MNAFNLSFARQLFLGLLVVAFFLVSDNGQAQTRFKATISITEIVSPPTFQLPCGPALKGDLTGKGTATTAGPVTAVSTDCIIPIASSPTGAEFIAISNGLTLTAANGDKIFAQYTASCIVTFTGAPGPQGLPGIGVIDGNFGIIGGTGKYSGSSGGGKLRGTELITIDPATGAGRGQGSVELTGSITVKGDEQ